MSNRRRYYDRNTREVISENIRVRATAQVRGEVRVKLVQNDRGRGDASVAKSFYRRKRVRQDAQSVPRDEHSLQAE